VKEKRKARLIDIAVFAMAILLFLATVLPRNLANLDEIWNFNFARNIANGLIPYKDFNMLQTPLLPFILRWYFKNIWSRIICYENSICCIRSRNIFYII